MDIQSNHTKGVFAVIIASILWGTTGTAASYSPDVSALAMGAFSTGTGVLLLVFTAQKRLLRDAKILLSQPWIFLLGSLSVAIYPIGFYTSMDLSGVAIGTLVSIATAPFFAVILERLFSQKLIPPQRMISFVIGAIGITLLAFGKQQSADTTDNIHQQGTGIVLGCVAGLAYAGYSWVARCLIEKGAHSRSAMSGLFGCAALLLLPTLTVTGDKLFSNTTHASVSLYMAIVPIFCGYLLFGFGLKYIHASQATVITLIEPLIATILAVVIIGEQFSVIGWLGAALVALCLWTQTCQSTLHKVKT